MSLIEKIDELEKHLVKNNSYFEGAEWLFGKVREVILSEQKNATEHDGCDGCLHEEKTNEEYPCNHCKQCYIDQWKPKPKQTIGDKIRESNESLSAFIRGQFGDDRVFHSGSQIDLDEFLNQPYTETN